MLSNMLKTFVVLFLLSLVNITKAQEKPALYQAFTPGGANPTSQGYISVRDPLSLNEFTQISLPSIKPERLIVSENKDSIFAVNDPILAPKRGVAVVSLSQQQIIRTLLDGISVYGAKEAPDGTIWFLLDEIKQIQIIDPNTLATTKTLTYDEPPRDVIFSPNGQKAYVSLLNKAVLEVNINDNHRVSRTISILPERNKFQVRPFELEISSDGSKLFVSGQDTISIVNTTSFITETIPLPISRSSFLLKLTPDGKFLYAAGYLGAQFVVINLESREIKTFRTPVSIGIFTALNISPDGRLAYISGFFGISIFDIEKQVFVANIQTTGRRVQDPFSLGLAISGDFTLGQSPTLTTISPSAGDNLFANQQIQINWQTTVAPQSYSLASHKVELSTNGGQSFTVIPGAEELPADARSFTWTVPNIQSANAQIRVSTVDLGARRATSTTGTFSILQSAPIDTQAPTVNFNSPVGGESFTSGSNLAIAWVSSDNIAVTSQDLSLSLDGGQTFPITIASGLAGSVQSFSFPIPENLATNQARLRLVVRDMAGNIGQSTTASNFTIAQAIDSIAPTVTISQPTSNSNVIAGSPIQVNWISTDNRAVISQALLLSLNGGQSFTTVASFGANDSSFLLNNINGLSLTTPQAIVRITATDQAGNTGQANTTFIISPMVMMANYQAKTLSVSGIGFMSNNGNSNSNLQVFINGKQVNVATMNLTNNSFSLKGNKKKLNLVKGANTINLVIDGVMSNQISFQF
ncbi:MAG: hypothetical protein WAQ98_19390 [Blastocatellia bacterium]